MHSMKRLTTLVVLAASLLTATFAGSISPAAASDAPGLLDQLTVRTISSRPEMVSGNDALVQVLVPRDASPSGLKIFSDGADITASFNATGGNEHIRQGKVPTGAEGSIIRVTLPGFNDQQLILVNHPLSGPILSGRHLNPLLCNTATAGLGAPQDADCTGNTVVTYHYRTTSNSWQTLADPTGPVPPDIATTTTNNGTVVPYAVATERGTLNRSIYAFSVLIDIGPGSNPNVAGSGFNGTAIFSFGGGCNNTYFQGNSGAGNPNSNVSSGFAYMQSSLNAFGQRCSDAFSAETVSMIKERFIENWGPIDKTIGTGGSGGSMAQQMINNNYPGLLDASNLSNSFLDYAYAANNLMDCMTVGNYVDTAGWSNDEKQAVLGGGVLQTCSTTVASFSGGFWAPDDCPPSVPPGDVYDPLTNPLGLRCTTWDANSNLWGKLPDGKARQVADNVGVQYGLRALLDGQITSAQFLGLNAGAGGLDQDGNPIPERRVADPQALRTAYQYGQLNEGGAGYSSIPAIDNRQYWIETVPNGHQIIHAISMQERMEKSAGGPVPHVIFTSPSGPDTNNGPASIPNARVWGILDKWVDAIQADRSDIDPRIKALNNAPAEATDRCFDGGGNVIAIEKQTINSGTCGSLYPSHLAPRMIAGGPVANDILKCQLKPIDPADYQGQLSAGQLATLAGIFPSGVCDWNVPGVEQTVQTRTWQAWPTGNADSTAPETAVSSGPAPVNAPSTVDFEFSSSQTGSSFECRLGRSETFRPCVSPERYRGLADGAYTFEVRARDGAGNADPTPASVDFRVGPEPVVNVRRNSRVLLRGRTMPRLRRARKQAVPVRCYTTNMDWCRGRVTLRVRGRALGLRHNRRVNIGSRTYTLKRGQRTVRVRIGNRARRIVRNRSRLKVRVITTSRQGNGTFRTANAGRRLRR
ncbi:MAG: hypothetical protein KDB48_04690 [Solirubrobacterales bacterium]|nr:hypothetical protein [Solirubrobacterales bacterium]